MIISIPESSFFSFSVAMEKIQRRAIKIGFDVPSYELIGQDLVIDDDGVMFMCHKVEVDNVQSKLNGYHLVAKIDHTAHLDYNVVHVFDREANVNVDEMSKADCFCEHCGTHRKRNSTYLVSDGSKLTQVGSSCLKDFTGHDSAEAIAKFYAEVFDVFAEHTKRPNKNSDWDEHYQYFNTDSVITMIMQHIKEFGYVKASEATESVRSTKSIIVDALLMGDGKIFPDLEFVNGFKDYVATLKNDHYDSFSTNLKNSLMFSGCRLPSIGYIAGGVSMYLKHLNKKEGKGSKAFGVEKARYDLELTLSKEPEVVESFYQSYGRVTNYDFVYFFEDEDGNCFKWSTGNGQIYNMYHDSDTHKLKIKLRGTVKKHYTTKSGTTITVLTRCSILEN
jgi:hypothetical protein